MTMLLGFKIPFAGLLVILNILPTCDGSLKALQGAWMGLADTAVRMQDSLYRITCYALSCSVLELTQC